ncbi:MAG: LytTR family DNA-binding domain-containing protein [Bacteroidota bacterium]
MNILLLDDEESARKTIAAYLDRSSLETFDLLEASTIDEGLKCVDHYDIDLLLLDIQLGNGTGFDFLSRLETVDFQLIFISAYDEFAIKAFKFNAIDYILKPINPLEFNHAIKRAVQKKETTTSKEQLSQLTLDMEQHDVNRVILKDSQAIHFVDIQDIVQCKSESNYTVFSLVDGSDITISKTLGEFEEMLLEKNFFRSHRSHLINLHQIRKYDRREGGFIQMKDGKNVPIARSRKDVFMKLINGF